MIETALVMTAVIMALSLLILSFVLMYQKALLTRAALKTARIGANRWVAGDQDLYYRIAESLLTSREEKSLTVFFEGSLPREPGKEIAQNLKDKLAFLKDTAVNELSRELAAPKETEVSVFYHNIFCFRENQVKLVQEMKLPLDSLQAFSGVINAGKLRAAGRAVITEPAEYIRNFDLVLELAARYESLSEGLALLKERIK